MKAFATFAFHAAVAGCVLFFVCSSAHGQDAPANASLRDAMNGGLAADAAVPSALDPAIQQMINQAVGPQYAAWAALAGLVVFAWGRIRKGRKNGLSWGDSILAALEGSNVPLIGMCACVLALTSCAQWNAFVSSPSGKATFALAELGLEAAMERNAISPGNEVLIQQGLAIVQDPSNQQNDMIYKIGELGLNAALSKGLVKEGDVLLIKKAEAIVQSAVVPPAAASEKNPGGKQPVAPPAVSMREPECLKICVPDYGTRVAGVLAMR